MKQITNYTNNHTNKILFTNNLFILKKQIQQLSIAEELSQANPVSP